MMLQACTRRMRATCEKRRREFGQETSGVKDVQDACLVMYWYVVGVNAKAVRTGVLNEVLEDADTGRWGCSGVPYGFPYRPGRGGILHS